MDKVQQIPLAERLQGAGPRSLGLPVAMGLYAEDFIGLVGQMTGQQDRYAEIYEKYIKPYEGEGGGKSVRTWWCRWTPCRRRKRQRCCFGFW